MLALKLSRQCVFIFNFLCDIFKFLSLLITTKKKKKNIYSDHGLLCLYYIIRVEVTIIIIKPSLVLNLSL